MAETSPDCTGAACADRPSASPVRVGYTQFAPYSSTSAEGIAKGYSIDLIRLLLEPQVLSIAFVPFDNPGQMIAALADGRIDATSLLGINPERAQFGAFTDVIKEFAVDVFVRNESPDLQSPDDLSGLRIAVSRGSTPERLVNAVEGTLAFPVASTDSLLLPLLSRHVDAVAAPREALLYSANSARLGHRLKRSSLTLSSAAGALLVDQTRTDLLETLNTAIANARADGNLARLYDRWFAASAVPYSMREQVAVAAAILLALVAVAFWVRLHRLTRARAERADDRATSLEEALNTIGAGVVIFDTDLKPDWWNDAHVRYYPQYKALLEAGTDYPQILIRALQDGTTGVRLDPKMAAIEAAKQLADLRSGMEIEVQTQVPGDRIIKRRMKRLSNGKLAAVGMDVTNLAESNRQLEEAGAQLRDANQRLADFSNVAAHDLVGPLRQLRNLHQWIVEDLDEMKVTLSAETQENLQDIDMILEREMTLVQDLLAYSKTEQLAETQLVDPGHRFDGIVGTAGIRRGFEVVLPETAPHVQANPTAFDIVLRNLIANAVKHHDQPSGTITVTADLKGEMCEFSVTDDGPGIPDRYRDYVFEPFRTLIARSRGGGSGLGLAFVKRIVTNWGGQFGVEPRPDGRGSRFWFTVPLAEDELAQAPHAQVLPFADRATGT